MVKISILGILLLLILAPAVLAEDYSDYDQFDRPDSATLDGNWSPDTTDFNITDEKMYCGQSSCGAENWAIGNTSGTYFRIDIKTGDATDETLIRLMDGGSGGTETIYTRVRNDRLEIRDPTTWRTYDTMLDNTMYMIEYKNINYTSYTFDAYLNGTFQATEEFRFNNPEIDMLLIGHSGTQNPTYIDNLAFGSPNQSFPAPPVVSNEPYYVTNVKDLFDTGNLQGLYVNWSNGIGNTTDTSGNAYCYNCSGGGTNLTYNVTDPNALYFSNLSLTGYENATANATVAGAYHTFTNILDGVDLTLTNVNLSYECGGSPLSNNGVTSGEEMLLKPNTTCTFNATHAEWFPVNTTVTTTGQYNSSSNISFLYNARIQFLGNITNASYEPNCLQNGTTLLSHNNAPYYKIIDGSWTLNCSGTNDYLEFTTTINDTRPYTSSNTSKIHIFTLTEYQVSLLFTESVDGIATWTHYNSSTEIAGKTTYNWTNTSYLRSISSFCTETDNLDCKVEILFDYAGGFPQYYEFYIEDQQSYSDTLTVQSAKDSFATFQILTTNGNPIQDARVRVTVANRTDTSEGQTHTLTNMRYTDAQGKVSFNFEEEDIITLLITKTGYRTTLKSYLLDEVINTTYSNPEPISLDERLETQVLDTSFYCWATPGGQNIYNASAVTCYINSPFADEFTLTTNYTGRAVEYSFTNNWQVQETVLTECEFPYQITGQICDWQANTPLLVTATVDGYNLTMELHYTPPSNETQTLIDSGTQVNLFDLPALEDTYKNPLIFILLVIIAIGVGQLLKNDERDTGMHAFLIGLVFAAAITSTFIFAAIIATLYYVARALQSMWEA